MQSLIPLVLAFSLVSGTPLSLIPYAYLSSPVPVYQQYQNTRTGEHAFSYAGGPSAQEEVKDADGVLRGSYSYIDANGILQSVFYVADDNGFRVAATNLPSDSNAEPAHVVLARSVNSQEPTKSRKRRSTLEDPAKSPSAEEGASKEESSSAEEVEKVALGKSLLPSLLLSGDIPLATSHQSQVQVHSNARLDLSELEAKPVDLQPILPVQTILGGFPVLARAPTYHENRIELHKNLGIEGAKPKDAVKIDPEPLTLFQPSLLPYSTPVIAKQALPLVPIFAKEAIPIYSAPRFDSASVSTSISSHGISQIHGPSYSGLIAKESVPVPLEKKEAVPLVPLVKDASGLPSATVTTSVSSHGISQIHGDSKLKIEPTLYLRTVPIAQLHHPIFDIPVPTLG